MRRIKHAGRVEVFDMGPEQPWAVWVDGRPFKSVWTPTEYQAIIEAKNKKSTKRDSRSSPKPRRRSTKTARALLERIAKLTSNDSGNYIDVVEDDDVGLLYLFPSAFRGDFLA